MNIELKKGPFIKSGDTVGKMTSRLIIALIPIILFAFYKNGILLYLKGYVNFYGMFYPLIFIILGTMSSLVGEELYYIIFKKQRGEDFLSSVKNSYGFVPGLLLSLVVPQNTPLAILFIGGMVASIIGKMVYGGLGQNIFNPALIGAIFIMVCYGTYIGGRGGYLNSYEIDAISSATPLTNYKIINTIDYDKVVTPYGSLLDFSLGFIPGTLGEVSKVLILLSLIYLVATKTIKWRITLSYLLTFFLAVSIYTYSSSIGLWNILFQMLSGGLLFGSVFMATDPVTSPISYKGQILYGILLGIITFLIRTLTNYPEGVMLSILIMNVFVFFVDKIGSRVVFNKKYIIYYVLVTLMLIGVPYYLGILKEKQIEENVEFRILNVSKDGKNTIYEVNQKGFGGNINAKITFDEAGILNVDIIKHYESEDRYKLIEDNNYINTLIKAKDVSKVDAVTSATITSNALKNMISNTLEKFMEENDVIQLISEEDNRTSTVYVVRVNGDKQKLDVQVVIKNNDIRTIIPLNYKDNCLNKDDIENGCNVEIDTYIKELIMNQNDLDSVGDLSISKSLSDALKKVVTYVKGLD